MFVKPNQRNSGEAAVTLIEVVIAIAILALSIGGIVYGYALCANRIEWSAYSLAAHALANQQVEQARACKWDPMAYPPVDQLQTNYFPTRTEILDVPVSKTNLVYATNYIQIIPISIDPPLKMIRVDCVWSFRGRIVSNTVVTCRSPDQ